jgi:hypothetical protein
MTTVEHADQPAKLNCGSLSNCQLTKLTVSQLSHFLVLIAAGVFLIFKAAPDEATSVSVAVLLNLSFALLYCLVAIFYFVGSWELEEKCFNELAQLKGYWRTAEIFVRASILFSIIFSVSIYSDIIESKVLSPEPKYGTLFVLMTIFCLFLLWDTLVVWGDTNGINIVKTYFMFDVVGCVICFVLILIGSAVAEMLASFVYCVFIGMFLSSQWNNHVKLKLSGGMR